ncbi:MAG TPA: DUF1573 domain-containing protein [Thermoanaerobaculia bacterium]|nr:DUF1573 domain-containing protein [Thermoanaerobaculia bacterium]
MISPRRSRFVSALAAAGLALAALPSLLAAQTKAAEATGPKLVIAEDKKDVGQVAKGEPIKHVFILKNTGNADLHITDVKPSCGCTVPEFDKVIKPGGEGKVTLTVDTKNFSGPISKTALLITDDPTVPQKTLFLSAVVKPFVDALPYGFFRITALSGEASSAEVVLVSDEPDFKPTKAEAPNSFLRVRLAPVPEKELLKDHGPNQWKVTVTTAPDAPEGLLGGTVKVATGVKKQPEIELQITGFIKPTVSVTPLSINFGNFDPKGDPQKRNVMLVNNNAAVENFSVMKAETSVPGISAEVVPVDKSRVQVVLTVDQKIKKGVFEGDLTIRTSDKAKAEVKVPIKGVIL